VIVPTLCNLVPNSVELIEKSTFTYNDHWVYNFVKSASGKDKELACTKKPSFKISITINSTVQQLRTGLISRHILEKTIDLVGRYDTYNKPYKYTIQKI
jgi:hypothetical protein